MKKLTNAKKRKIRRTAVILMASVVIALAVLSGLMKIIASIYNTNEKENEYKFDYSRYAASKPHIKKMLLTENINSRPGLELSDINGIVIHYTANPGTDAEANRNYFESRKDEADSAENKVSSHFIIGLDGTIVQCIPLNEIAYASKDRNVDTISIECCHPDETGKFSDATYTALIQLSGWLCGKFEIDKNSIIRHYDVTGKMCPLYYVDNEEAWDNLKNDIWQYFLSCKKDLKSK